MAACSPPQRAPYLCGAGGPKINGEDAGFRGRRCGTGGFVLPEPDAGSHGMPAAKAADRVAAARRRDARGDRDPVVARAPEEQRRCPFGERGDGERGVHAEGGRNRGAVGDEETGVTAELVLVVAGRRRRVVADPARREWVGTVAV